MIVYGIKNCDTVQKMLTYLDSHGIEYTFVDFKKSPPNAEQLKQWKSFFGDGWVNTKGPTFRKIKEAFEASNDAEKFNLILNNSSAIKRPILMRGNKPLLNGFVPDKLKEIFELS